MPTLDEAIASNVSLRRDRKRFEDLFEELAFAQDSPSDDELGTLFGGGDQTKSQVQSASDLLKGITPLQSPAASGGGLSNKAIRAINAARSSPTAQKQASFAASERFRGGTPTRAESPVAQIGKGGAKEGLDLLRGLSGIDPSGNKQLESAITGVASGFGAANVVFTPKKTGGSLPLEIGKFSQPGSFKDIKVSAGPAGDFRILVPKDVLELGQGLEVARQRANAIEAARARKKSVVRRGGAIANRFSQSLDAAAASKPSKPRKRRKRN